VQVAAWNSLYPIGQAQAHHVFESSCTKILLPASFPNLFELDGDGEVIPSAAALLPRWSEAKRPAKN
jgi:hypothetical protein